VKENKMNKFWNLVGVKRTKIYSGEYTYERKNYYLDCTREFLIEMAYMALLAVLTSIELAMNMIHYCDIGLACTVVGFICGLVLLPTVIDITEGYDCVQKALW
jgi:hypothetical protein